MCDIWKANAQAKTLTCDELRPHFESIEKLEIHRVVLSGGEPLLHKNLWTLCSLITELLQAKITLLSTGLTIEKHAESISHHIDDVILSLDGSPKRHEKIRRIPDAYERMHKGVKAVRSHNAQIKISARSVVQKQNFKELSQTIDAAKNLGLDSISFLPVDIATDAFNHTDTMTETQTEELGLTKTDIDEFEQKLETLIQNRKEDFDNKFISESPEKMRRMVQFFRAQIGEAPFPEVRCNAPWVSTVVESDGRVMPCFFQSAFGRLEDGPLEQIINSSAAVNFRKNLDVKTDPICQTCVCSLELGARGIV